MRRKSKFENLHGFNGQREIRSKLVENPLSEGEFNPVPVNIRESSLENMLARKRIGQAQYMAGSRFRSLYETIYYRNMAVDPSNEPVDFGGRKDAFALTKLEAGRELSLALDELVPVRQALVISIAGDGLTITQAARKYIVGDLTKYDRLVIGKQFREGLKDLASYWGYMGTAPGGKKISPPMR